MDKIDKIVASSRREWERIICRRRRANVEAIRPAINYVYKSILRRGSPEIIRISSPNRLKHLAQLNCGSVDTAFTYKINCAGRNRHCLTYRASTWLGLEHENRVKLVEASNYLASLVTQQMQTVSHLYLYNHYSRVLVSTMAIYDMMGKLGYKCSSRDAPELSMRLLLCRHAFYWFACEGKVIVCDSPEAKYDTSGRLHCENGPALEFDKDCRYFFWHGESIPEQIILAPEKQSLEDIHQESNVETRRIRIERYGWQRYLQETQAAVLNRRDNEALLDSRQGRVLVCSCPSTARVYALEVPRDIQTCEQAQNWLSSGLEKKVVLVA